MAGLPLARFAHVEQDGTALGEGGRLRRRHGLIGLAEQVLEPHAHKILPV
jgi:hypothetical protein